MNANVIDFPINAGSDIDRLGDIKAQIAALEAEAKAIADDYRAKGVGSYLGLAYRVTVADEQLVRSFNAEKAKAKLRELGVADSVIEGDLVDVKIRAGAVSVKAL
jgi:D-serine deaminase-like pyridoxal phosphate-dependent protein